MSAQALQEFFVSLGFEVDTAKINEFEQQTARLRDEMLKIGTPSGQNTTIGVVATDAVLTKAQALRMATCAHDGYARTIRPVHTQMDGDTVFALGTGRIDADVNPVQLCAAAAEVMARAVQNAIWAVQHA